MICNNKSKEHLQEQHSTGVMGRPARPHALRPAPQARPALLCDPRARPALHSDKTEHTLLAVVLNANK
jgi:hypothetical protein